MRNSNALFVIGISALVSVLVNMAMKPKPIHQLTIKEILESPVLSRELDDLRVSTKYVESDLEGLVHGDPRLTLSRVDRCIDAARQEPGSHWVRKFHRLGRRSNSTTPARPGEQE